MQSARPQPHSQEPITSKLAAQIDAFERYSRPHSRLMADLSSHLARRLGLIQVDINAIAEAALLHDIGLAKISPHYLHAPRSLTIEERIEMWRHPIVGEQEMAKRGASRHAQLLVRWHHEWWIGTGYPDRLSFEDIPIGARILRAVDLYSALISDRPYRQAFTEEEARAAVRASAGIECDPYVVKALLALLEEVAPLPPSDSRVTEFHAVVHESEAREQDDQGGAPIESLSVAQSEPPLAGQQVDVPSASEEGSAVGAEPQIDAASSLHSTPAELAPLVAESIEPNSSLEETAAGSSDQSHNDSMGPSVLDANIDDAITRVDSSASSEGAPLGSETEHTSKATHVTDPATRPWDEHTERDRHREDLEVGAGQTTPKETPRGLEPGPSIVRQTSWVLGTQGPPSAPEPAAAYQPHFEPTAKPEQKWDGWLSSPYNTKSLLGFQASVLRQLEFRSIAIPVCGWAHLVWYLKVWGKQIFSNDPRAWAAAASRTVIEPGLPLSEEQATDLIADAYVPAQRLTNPSLRDWFGESDACFMDNLREKIEQIENRHERDQALLLGIRTGDYAHAFGADSSDLRRPLTYVLRQFAAASYRSTGGHPYNRSSQMPSEEFIRAVRSDLLYLNLPAGHAELAGSYGRSRWRECWLTRNPASGDDEVSRLMTAAQSKQSYLAMVDRMLAAAGHLKVWAIECRNIGLASADEIAELVEAHRPVRATYSKDLTEVAGGLKNFAIVAQTR